LHLVNRVFWSTLQKIGAEELVGTKTKKK